MRLWCGGGECVLTHYWRHNWLSNNPLLLLSSRHHSHVKFACRIAMLAYTHHHNALVLITLHKNVNYTVVHIFKVPLMLIKLEMEPLYLQRPSWTLERFKAIAADVFKNLRKVLWLFIFRYAILVNWTFLCCCYF